MTRHSHRNTKNEQTARIWAIWAEMTKDEAIGVICETIGEAQAVLEDHKHGKWMAQEVVSRLTGLFEQNALLRAQHVVGAFPPDTPPPVTIAGN